MSALVHMHGETAVTDSRTIAREFSRRHDNVMLTIKSLIADGTLGLLDFKETSYADQWDRQQRCYELTERGALVAMPFIGGRRSRQGQARLVDAFMALRTAEREQNATPLLPDFTNPVLAARAWADAQEQRLALQLTVERQAVDVVAFARLSCSDGSMCITDAAKQLKVPPRKLSEWLDANAWTYRRAGGRPIPYQTAIIRGVLTHDSHTIQLKDGTHRLVPRVHVTPKGLAELARKAAGGTVEGC